jgi:hypothetical protein
MLIQELYTNDPEVKKIARQVFPDYKGNSIEVIEFNGPKQLPSYWDGGSRDYWAIMNLSTNNYKMVPENGTPFVNNGKIFRISKLPPNFAIINYHTGRVHLLRIYVNKDNLSKMIPQTTNELPWAEKVVLAATAGLKSSYGGISNYRYYEANKDVGITKQEWESAKASLIGKRLLNSAGAITGDGRNAIGDTRLRHLEKPKQVATV